jgi:hypothetical protein
MVDRFKIAAPFDMGPSHKTSLLGTLDLQRTSQRHNHGFRGTVIASIDGGSITTRLHVVLKDDVVERTLDIKQISTLGITWI